MKVYNKNTEAVPKEAVYIGRGSKWGNPYIIGKHGTREEVIDLYREYIGSSPNLIACLPELVGKDLVCYCRPRACHGDVLLELVADLTPCAICDKLIQKSTAAYLRSGGGTTHYICADCIVPGGAI